MPLAETRVGELGGQCRRAANQLQAAVVHALDAPLQVMDIDLDVMGDRIAARPGKLRSVVAILLACELGIELNDAPVDRLQLQDLRGRCLPGGKGHPFEKVQNHPGIHHVGLGPLHTCPRKILNRPRIGYHHLHVLGTVQSERELQAVNPGRLQTDSRRAASLGRPLNELLVPDRAVRKRAHRSTLPSALHGAHQLLRIHIHSDLIDLLHGGSRNTLKLRFPRPCSLAIPTLRCRL